MEITYGLERIAMYLQNVESVFDIKWNEWLTYGEVFKKAEYEWSLYNFEKSDHNLLFELYERYEGEVKRLISEKLVMPAYDYLLKCSHTFNLLDAKGVISVQERARYIRRMNSLAKEIAKLYLDIYR
ncbi:Glycine--tRNA ligase alpha subunit [bacterium HR13]|nr:Glycine--tRNA ligase alpha subunit [bacterium HR13]